MKIPKIIHQIWSGVNEPLPSHFKELGETWKRDYPDWEYILWDNKMMNYFIVEHYPQYIDTYKSFPYNIQRWDSIRYLILEEMGGMYVDFDYESIEPMDKLIADKTCCFSIEPDTHKKIFPAEVEVLFNNALMLSIPNHSFMRNIIENIFEREWPDIPDDKFRHVLMTTGPWLLTDLYYQLPPEKMTDVYLIPAKYVTPFDHSQTRRLLCGEVSDELESCLNEAYAVHYFFGDWTKKDD